MSSESSEDLFQILLKQFLKAAYLLTHKFNSFSAEMFSLELNRTKEEVSGLLSVLIGMNMIKKIANPLDHYIISPGGKNNLKIILTGGVFDIIHLGHLKTLKKAKEEGDILIVVVASDRMVENSKGRLPLNPQNNRMKLLEELSIVDIAARGDQDSSKFLDTVLKYEPDVIVLGYDQESTEKMLLQHLEKADIQNFEIKKLDSHIPNEKSSQKMKNIDQHSFE
ncbi:MAG: adenylyltransferase/cytidyltransferase family protein [Candidatus Hodarchaeales archaeon]|jgi:glycerol-3-phosphate cytidylyltransferase/FAD synthetase